MSTSDIKKRLEWMLEDADKELSIVRSLARRSFRGYSNLALDRLKTFNYLRYASLRAISTRKLVVEYHSLLLYELGIDRRSDKKEDWDLLEKHAKYLEAVASQQRSLIRLLIGQLEVIELAAEDDLYGAHVPAYAKLPSMERDRREILYLREDAGSYMTEAYNLRQLRVRSEGKKKLEK